MGLAIGAIKDLQKHSLILLIFFCKTKALAKKMEKTLFTQHSKIKY